MDDEEVIANLNKDILEAQGYQVTTMENPTLALAHFREDPRRYQMLITDYTMPGMTGEALASEVLKTRPDLPVIITTGFSEFMDPDRALEAGIAELIHKPIRPGLLRDTVRRILDTHVPIQPAGQPAPP